MIMNVKRQRFLFSLKHLPLLLGLLNISVCLTSNNQNQELIWDLHSKIVVNQDSSLTITETIIVNVLQQKIKRGITRSFPTNYQTKFGSAIIVDFKVTEVLLDKKPCHYEIKNCQNGKLVLFGDERFIKPGKHIYQITYQTNRQLKFTSNLTELYFNIIGNDVIFPILKASADIYLPTDIPADKIELYGYTGFYGQKDNNYQSWIIKPNICHFETTNLLLPKQGFTISVAFPAGLGIEAPSTIIKLKWFLKDNLDVIILLLGILLLLLIYGRAWYKISQSTPIITPLFYPPKNLLPADCYYIYHKRFSNTVLTATIVDMAVNGYLKIKYHPGSLLKSDSYTLIKNNSLELPTNNPKYDRLIELLFAKNTELKLDKTNYLIITKALGRLNFITNSSNQHFIETDEQAIALGVSVSLITVFSAFWFSPSSFAILLFLLIIALNILALYSLKYYTIRGKELYAQIVGFKTYLNYTEKDRIERLNPPQITSEIFEKYLPYAIALGVDHAWTNQFNQVYSSMVYSTYQPHWFIGRRFNLNSFNSDLRNFGKNLNKAITTPPHAPGNFSGRGGGGFSGGGGGGGGIGGR